MSAQPENTFQYPVFLRGWIFRLRIWLQTMRNSTHLKGNLAQNGEGSSGRASFFGRCVAFAIALAFVTAPGLSLAQSPCAGIHVKILDIRNSTGTVACALFNAPDGFPTEFLRHATRIMMMKIQDTQARCDFLNIEPGTYALAVIHDENMDGKLETNWLGVPTEGYGFSAEAEVSMSAPSFEDASFPYGGEGLDLTISLTY